MEVMLLIKELPEGMVRPVDPDLDEHKQIPFFVLQQVLYYFEPSLSHLVKLRQEIIPFLKAKVNVEDILSNQVLDLNFQLWRIRVFTIAPRGHETGDEVAIDLEGRVRGRHTNQARFLVCLFQNIPDSPLADFPRVGNPHISV